MKRVVAVITVLCLALCCLAACGGDEFDRVADSNLDESFGKKEGTPKTQLKHSFEIIELGNNSEDDILHYMYETAWKLFDRVEIVTYEKEEDIYCMLQVEDRTSYYTYVDGQFYLLDTFPEYRNKKRCEAEYGDAKHFITSAIYAYALPTAELFSESEREEDGGKVILTYTGFTGEEEYIELAEDMGRQLQGESGVASDFELVSVTEGGEVTSSVFSWYITASTPKGEVKIRCIQSCSVTKEELSILPPSGSSSYSEVSGIDKILAD